VAKRGRAAGSGVATEFTVTVTSLLVIGGASPSGVEASTVNVPAVEKIWATDVIPLASVKFDPRSVLGGTMI
jgi:hypothetical protein